MLKLASDLGRDVTWVKVRSGTAGIPVRQDADREFKFVVEFPDAAGPA
jgi:hypothetical protein